MASVSVSTPSINLEHDDNALPDPVDITLTNNGDVRVDWSATIVDGISEGFSLSAVSGSIEPGATATVTVTFTSLDWSEVAYEDAISFSFTDSPSIIAVDGDASTDLGFLSDIVEVDGAVFSGTRDALHDLLFDGEPHTIKIGTSGDGVASNLSLFSKNIADPSSTASWRVGRIKVYDAVTDALLHEYSTDLSAQGVWEDQVGSNDAYLKGAALEVSGLSGGAIDVVSDQSVQPDPAVFTVTNSGGRSAFFTISESPAVDWVSVTPSSGEIPASGSQVVTANFPAMEDVGNYATELVIASPNASASASVAVSRVVNAGYLESSVSQYVQWPQFGASAVDNIQLEARVRMTAPGAFFQHTVVRAAIYAAPGDSGSANCSAVDGAAFSGNRNDLFNALNDGGWHVVRSTSDDYIMESVYSAYLANASLSASYDLGFVNIYDMNAGGALIHSYLGGPSDSGWIDQTGSKDGTIVTV